MSLKFVLASTSTCGRGHTRRAATLVATAVAGVILCGFTALAIDLGYVMTVRAELQSAADAAAMAGVSALIDPDGIAGTTTDEERAYNAYFRAMEYASKNLAATQSVYLEYSDVTVGNIAHPENLQSQLLPHVTPYNTIQALVKKSPDSFNGPVSLFFATIWGKDSASVWAEATAYLDNKVIGYKPAVKQGPGALVPIAVRKQKWQDEIVSKGGEDNYGYDPDTGQVIFGPDGVVEVSIYPEKKKADDSSDGAGNFGLLDINNGNNAATVGEQIRNGVSPEDVLVAFGEPDIRFANEDGSPKTHIVSGTTGLKASLKDDLEARKGSVIGFLIHTDVIESGNNGDFTTTDIQFGRVMMVSFSGSPNQKVLVIQPAAYLGREIITDPGAPAHETGGTIKLIR